MLLPMLSFLAGVGAAAFATAIVCSPGVCYAAAVYLYRLRPGIGHQCSHLGGGALRERLLRQHLALCQVERADLRLNRRNHRDADAELAYAETDQDRNGLRVACNAAAHAHPA